MYMLKELNGIGQEVDKYVYTWTTGDTKGMESLILKGMTEEVKRSSIPEKFFYQRNRTMVMKIEDLLKSEETYFVIVGAGHLVGSKGIIEMIVGKGYLVEQL